MITPYALFAIYIVCLILVEKSWPHTVQRKNGGDIYADQPRVRVAVAAFWFVAIAIATLILYRGEWPGYQRALLNVLWALVITMSLVWAVLVIRPAARLPADENAPQFTPMQMPELETEHGAHWVGPEAPPPPSIEAGPTRKRFDQRQRTLPVFAKVRRKRNVT